MGDLDDVYECLAGELPDDGYGPALPRNGQHLVEQDEVNPVFVPSLKIPKDHEDYLDCITSHLHMTEDDPALWNPKLKNMQSVLTAHLDNAARERLLKQANKELKALILSCDPTSLAFLSRPSLAVARASNQAVIHYVRRRLGLPCSKLVPQDECPGSRCDMNVSEMLHWHHPFVCPTTRSSGLTHTHDEITRRIQTVILTHEGSATLEPMLWRHNHNVEKNERGDLLVFVGAFKGMILDVSVANPVAPSAVDGAQTQGKAAAVREQSKINKYQNKLPPYLEFFPVVVESFGRLGKETKKGLKQLARQLSKTTQEGTTWPEILQELKVAIGAGLTEGTGRLVNEYRAVCINAIERRGVADLACLDPLPVAT